MRTYWAIPAVLVSLLGGVVNGQSVHAQTPLCSATANHVKLVVEHGTGTTLQRCVGISSSSASAESVLGQSGVEYATDGYGGSLGDALCQVDQEPSTYPQSCFGPNQNWAIFVLRSGGSWQETPVGLSNLELNNGDTLGLRYETGSSPPPNPTVVCTQPTQAASSTASATTANASSNRTSSATQRAAAAATGNPTPPPSGTATASVQGISTKVGSSAPKPPPTAGLDVGLLLACLCGGGFLGLLGMRLKRR